MTSIHERCNIIIPRRFKEIFEEFLKYVEKEPDFKKGLDARMTKKGQRDKRIRPNAMTSAKVRFVIARYVNEKRADKRRSREVVSNA